MHLVAHWFLLDGVGGARGALEIKVSLKNSRNFLVDKF
jgi:hypothetical protein